MTLLKAGTSKFKDADACRIEFEERKNRQIYWDDVALFCYPEEYQLGIRPMNKDDIIEVDNFSELVALDSSYKKYEGEA